MFRLPNGWGTPANLDDVVVAAGVKIHRSGVAVTSPSGEEICGAAADRAGRTKDRAWFELAERVCVLEAFANPRASHPLLSDQGEVAGKIAGAKAFPVSQAPKRWVVARSNGIALHADWPRACQRAFWELAERDRILRSWRGEIAPRPLKLAPPTKHYEWLAYSFPSTHASFSSELDVVGVFAFPLTKRAPLAMGFAARPVLGDALDAATLEAFQQLAFLWDESVPTKTALQPPGAGLHLDTYQVHANHPQLRAWLDGAHLRYVEQRLKMRRSSIVRFVDLSAPWLKGKARVAKAVCPAALELGFGKIPTTAHLPVALQIHPIA